MLLAATLSWRAAFGLVSVLATVTVLGLLLNGVGSGPLTRSSCASDCARCVPRPSSERSP